MELDDFLLKNDIPHRANVDDQEEFITVVASVVAHTDNELVFEYSGTQYHVSKKNVLAVEPSHTGVVTRTGIGVPTTIRLQADTRVSAGPNFAAKEFDQRSLPYVLAKPSDLRLAGSRYQSRHASWLQARGIRSGFADTTTDTFCESTSTSWTDTTSPVTGDPAYPQDYDADDSTPDGNPPDENYNDDLTNDDVG